MHSLLEIRLCTNVIQKTNSIKFHGLIFRPEPDPLKSGILQVDDLMKQFDPQSEFSYLTEKMKTPLTPEELLFAAKERIEANYLKFQIRQTIGTPNFIAEFYIKTTQKSVTAVAMLAWLMENKDKLQIPAITSFKTKETPPYYSILQKENARATDYYDQRS